MLKLLRRIHSSRRLYESITSDVTKDAPSKVAAPSNKPIKDTSYRLMVSPILVRNPIILRPLSEFEVAYEEYQGEIQQQDARGEFKVESSINTNQAGRQQAAPPKIEIPSIYQQKNSDLTSLMRKLERKLYFVIKNDADEWRFPATLVKNADVPISQISFRFLHRLFGTDCELYVVGNSPVAYHKDAWEGRLTAPFGDKTFFIRAQLISGNLQFKPNPFARSYAWLTKEELSEHLTPDYYRNIEPVLSY